MKPLILEKRLVELRLQARAKFPSATYLPGDECSVGTRCRNMVGDVVEVVGPYSGDQQDFAYWWLCVYLESPNEYLSLQWPSTLTPVILQS